VPGSLVLVLVVLGLCAVGFLVSLGAREHPVSRAAGSACEHAGEQARLRALEARLALAERACELADVFDRHAAWADPRYVAALNAALDEWRAAKEGTCSGSAS